MSINEQPRNQATERIRTSLPLLTPDQVCDQLAITKRTLYEMVQRGRIAHLKLNGRQLRFRQEQVDAYVDAQIVPVRRRRVRAVG